MNNNAHPPPSFPSVGEREGVVVVDAHTFIVRLLRTPFIVHSIRTHIHVHAVGMQHAKLVESNV